MRKLSVIALLFSGLHWIGSQEYIPWESYYFRDSVAFSDEFDFEEHRSIYPRINYRRTNVGKNTEKNIFVPKLKIMPIADLVMGQTADDFQYRTGAGFALDYFPLRGMQLKFAYVGGLANTNTINYQGGVYPFSVVRKPFGTNNMMHYHDIRARLSYSPNKFFNFQAGIDQNRFGEGDRSVLLDDYGTPYPFMLMRIKVWRFEYVSMQTYLQNPNANFKNTRPKFSAMHYLSMNLLKGFNWSFFEAVVYDGIIGNQRRGLEWEYLNPLVVYRPLEFALGSTDKVQIGTNLSYRFNAKATVYSQYMIDEFLFSLIRERQRHIANKFSFQLGFKGNIELGQGQFHYLSELNLVRPYTYAHRNPGQTFSNMSNPLAHPLGSNFVENSTRLLYKKNRFDYSLDFVYYLRGVDFNDSVHWGGDVNVATGLSPVDEFGDRILRGFYIGSGNKTNVAKMQIGLGYTLLPKFRTRVFGTFEALWFTQNQQTTFYPGFYFGLRTELWNDRRNY